MWAVPDASFIATPATQTLPNSIVTIDNTSSAGTWNYYWDFGDGSNSNFVEPDNHTYSTFGNFNISLIVSSAHCSDTIVNSIQIIAPTPIAEFSINEFGCAPLTVQFINQSQYANIFLWDFGDGGASTSENPLYTYSNYGDFTVQLTASGPGGQDIKTGGIVHVYQNPVAYFTVAPTVVFLPDQPIHCFNTSENAVSFVWDFGDGTSSIETNPSHQYMQEGEFTIILIASTINQCVDTFLIFKAVVAKSAGQINFPSAFSPSTSGPNDGHYTPGDYNNDVFHPVFVGIDEYQFSIFNRWGELLFESNDPNIGWNGYYREQLCKQDVYVWKAKGKFINGKTFFKAGDVTLIR